MDTAASKYVVVRARRNGFHVAMVIHRDGRWLVVRRWNQSARAWLDEEMMHATSVYSRASAAALKVRGIRP